MSRLVILVVGLLVVAALALLLGWVDVIDWESVGRLDALLSSLLALGVIGAFAAAGGGWLTRRVIRAPMRRAWRSEGLHGGSGTREAVIDTILELAQEPLHRPGRVIARLNALDEERGERSWPWESVSRLNWFREVSRRLSDGLVPRLFAPDTARSVAALADSVAHAMEDLLHYRVVPTGTLQRKRMIGIEGPDDLFFREAATVLSGAVVLADAVHSRSGASHGLRVWPSAAMRPAVGRFGDTHALGARDTAGRVGCPWGAALREDPRSLAGDFDGRVLELRGVSVVQDDRSEGVELLLSTNESCYAATEVVAGSDVRCKGLTPDLAADRPPRWSFDPATSVVRRADADGSRLCLTTAFATLVLQHTDSCGATRRQLVLTERSRVTRNGAATLSVTGGGVVNLPIGKWEGDEDDSGFPALGAAVARELTEELGLQVSPHQAIPASVYMITQRSPDLRGSGRGTGELVATAAFTVTVPMTFEHLCGERIHASPAKGRYESVGLIAVDLADVDDHRDAAEPHLSAATDFARRLMTAHGSRLDQRAMLGALYVAAEVYGPSAALAAFAQQGAWWARGWDRALDRGDGTRLVIPPARLMDDRSAQRLSEVAAVLGIDCTSWSSWQLGGAGGPGPGT